MVQRETLLTIADNSGAKIAKIFGIPGASKKKYAHIGDVVNVAHEVGKAVIVRVHKEYRRKDGTYIRFDDNAGVLIDPKTKAPKGSRIFGPVARELKEKGFDKIVSLAPEVL